jgi:hypothetical protein
VSAIFVVYPVWLSSHALCDILYVPHATYGALSAVASGASGVWVAVAVGV